MRHIQIARRALALATLVPALAIAQSLPTPKELMEKHNAAAGGRAALEKHSSIHMIATMNMAAMGMQAAMEVYKAKPNKFVQKITIPQMGDVMQGFDGKVAWASNPMGGAQLLDGALADNMKSNADFLSSLQYDSVYTKAETVELTDFEGRKCYKVHLVREGRDGFEYFDQATGLIAGVSGTTVTPQGNIESTTVMHEWMDVDGVKFPKVVEQRTPNGPATITFSAIEFDKVDPAVFELPAAVKALVKP